MADIDEILRSQKSEIQKELYKNRKRNRHEMSRDHETRPWHSRIPQFGLQEEIEESLQSKSTPTINNLNTSDLRSKTASTKHFLLHQFISQSIREHWKITIFAWFTFLSISFGFVSQMPNNYFSTLYLFAPETSQSISSRLPLFSNRVEYASFPMELKIPISILSRQLRKEDARKWVISEYLSHHSDVSPATLHLDEVRVEPGYVPTTEILVIEGFAYDPEMAKEITDLYWQYFNLQIKRLEDEHRARVRDWFFQTNASLDSQIETLLKRLEPDSNEKQSPVNLDMTSSRLSESFTNTQTQRSLLLAERDELLRAQTIEDLNKLSDISDRDINSMIQIRRQLLESPDSQLYFNRLSQVEAQIRDLIGQKIREKDSALIALSQNSSALERQLGSLQKASRQRKIVGSMESDLVNQITTLRSYKSEIAKLKSQLELEPEVNNVKTKVLQRPIANPDSMRPSLSTRYGMAFAISTAVTLMATLLMSLFRLTNRKTSENT